MKLNWLAEPAKEINQSAIVAATARQQRLTKPAGSLGYLEETAIRLAGMQGRDRPQLDRVHIAVFAADHGVANESVSAFPQAVTVQMVRNFARGGAAISVLASELDATLEVIDVGTACDPGPLEGVTSRRVASGTANFSLGPAMDETQLEQALAIGRHAAQGAVANGAELFVGGEMGIGNTTSATALACVLLKKPPSELAGPGTGLDTTGVVHKAQVIERALVLHQSHIETPLQAMCCLGGFEIAALSGAYLTCAQAGVPVLVDGFISSVAALVATKEHPSVTKWLIFAHRSAERAHSHVLAVLKAKPLLDLGMRLGEGSGAAIAVPLLRLACALHDRMATFEEAGVTDRSSVS